MIALNVEELIAILQELDPKKKIEIIDPEVCSTKGIWIDDKDDSVVLTAREV